jgi:CRISPR system Cascade subunit CasC
MFLQIHTLTSFAAALLNRDDAGLAKRIPFGNAERMRISSQCLKKHWRDDFHRNLALPGAIRSRMFFEREVLARALAGGVSEQTARKLTELLLKRLVQGGQDKDKPLRLKQPVLFGKPEADYLVRLVRECAASDADPVKLLEERLKAEKGNLQAMWKAAGVSLVSGVEGAMFGRFVTSDILARTDAAVHVAHAFTVHPLSTEVDYFTVVDDLKEADEDAGAAHAGDMELGAGLFYGYVVVDVPLLVSNLCGCDPLEWKKQPPAALQDARDVLERLVQAIATVSPGAKLGATAPYARAELVLLESGATQPRTLANAYLQALKPKGNPLQQAVDALGQHLATLDAMYGREEQRFVASTQDTASLGDVPRAPVRGTVKAALDTLLGAV